MSKTLALHFFPRHRGKIYQQAQLILGGPSLRSRAQMPLARVSSSCSDPLAWGHGGSRTVSESAVSLMSLLSVHLRAELPAILRKDRPSCTHCTPSTPCSFCLELSSLSFSLNKHSLSFQEPTHPSPAVSPSPDLPLAAWVALSSLLTRHLVSFSKLHQPRTLTQPLTHLSQEKVNSPGSGSLPTAPLIPSPPHSSSPLLCNWTHQ